MLSRIKLSTIILITVALQFVSCSKKENFNELKGKLYSFVIQGCSENYFYIKNDRIYFGEFDKDEDYSVSIDSMVSGEFSKLSIFLHENVNGEYYVISKGGSNTITSVFEIFKLEDITQKNKFEDLSSFSVDYYDNGTEKKGTIVLSDQGENEFDLKTNGNGFLAPFALRNCAGRPIMKILRTGKLYYLTDSTDTQKWVSWDWNRRKEQSFILNSLNSSGDK